MSGGFFSRFVAEVQGLTLDWEADWPQLLKVLSRPPFTLLPGCASVPLGPECAAAFPVTQN